jgi:hypothetical protein
MKNKKVKEQIKTNPISNPKKYKNEIINKLPEKFVEQVKNAFQDAQKGINLEYTKHIPFRKIDEEEANKINRATGIDVSGYEHTVSNTGFRHIFKHHSNEENEKLKRQVPIVIEDVLLIPDITKNYDNISLSPEKDILNRPILIYRKKIGELYYYYEAIGGKKYKKLFTRSMFKKKK